MILFDILVQLAPAFQKHLLEILMGIILMFNVGAYSLLQRQLNHLEQDIEENDTRINKLKKTINTVWNRIFGIDADDTAPGYLMETDERFDQIDEKLEEICQKMDVESDTRQRQFQMIEGQLDEVITRLSDEEDIDLTKDDFEMYSGD